MPSDRLEAMSKTVQVLSVVAGVVISVLSFNQAREHEAEARVLEAQKQQVDAAKPFLDLRQHLYLETVQQAAVLSNQEVHTKAEVEKARKRFRELYVAELSMIEGKDVAASMVQLAEQVDSELVLLTPQQKAAYDLSHVLRDSLLASWKLDEKNVVNPGKDEKKGVSPGQ